MRFDFPMLELLTIGQVAKRSGVAASAIRFYEERGLLASVRSGTGHRRFPRPALRRIAFIVFAQRIGFTLEEVGAELARFPTNEAPSKRDWTRLTRTWQKRIDERIAELERLRIGLATCIGCGCLSMERCPYANPADRMARLGPGPRFFLGDRPRLEVSAPARTGEAALPTLPARSPRAAFRGTKASLRTRDSAAWNRSR